MIRVGVVGARGHVGAELLPLLFRHPEVEVAWVTSSRAAGESIAHAPELRYREPDPSLLDREPVDAVFLALPNGQSEPWTHTSAILVDLSSDHRSDPAWTYAQPERFREKIRTSRRLAMPGCYATAAQLAIAPLVPWVAGTIHVFGVSGYSGAGVTPSERNDPEVLRDNLLPYAVVGHAHERELRRHLGVPVRFVPNVAPFFRGLVVTVSCALTEPKTTDEVVSRITKAYENEPFVLVQNEPPRPRDVVGRHDTILGGIAVDEEGRHAVVLATLDNLRGGAASQAVRALNLAVGIDERTGLS